MAIRKKFSVRKSSRKKLSKKQKIIIAIVSAVVLAAAGVTAFMLWPKEVDDYVSEEEITRHYSPLTGMETTEKNTELPVTAVIIENSPEARPQSGLVGDNVVFEAVAEGGITRFDVLFQEDQPKSIGPIRSLRSYYLEWSTGFDAAQAHVGGSGDALEMIRSGNYAFDIDETVGTIPIWRSDDRYAPHNAYSSGKSLYEYEIQNNKKTSEFTAWERQDGERIKPPKKEESDDKDTKATADTNIYANSINLPISTGLFAVNYEYNTKTNSYDRYQGGEPHEDQEKGQISPDVVIAMMVSQHLKSDGLHNDIDTASSGIAYIFQNGIMEKASWKKQSVKDNIEFIDQAGNNIKLNRGQTWITAIDKTKTPTWQ